MASTANGPGRTEISPTGQLFRVDRRLPAGPGVDEAAVATELGGVAEQLGAAAASDPGGGLRALPGRLLLDLFPERVGDRPGVWQRRLPEAADAPAGAARRAELFQCGRDALLRQESDPGGGDSRELPPDPANRPAPIPGRRTGEIPAERELGQVLRQSLQPL